MSTAFSQLNQEMKVLKQQVEKSKVTTQNLGLHNKNLCVAHAPATQDSEARLKALETENDVLRDDASVMLQQILSLLQKKSSAKK